MTGRELLALTAVGKTYASVRALQDVSLTRREGDPVDVERACQAGE